MNRQLAKQIVDLVLEALRDEGTMSDDQYGSMSLDEVNALVDKVEEFLNNQ